MKELRLVAACVLVDGDSRILISRRPAGKSMAGLWEFPGGKLRPGESPEACLCRELREELGIDVSASCLAPLNFASHFYAEEGFHLLMPVYVCMRWDGVPRPLEGQETRWVGLRELREYRMPAADLPLLASLRQWL